MTDPSGPRPPRLAEWLLRCVLPEGVIGDSILGDVREEHAEYVRRGGLAPGVWYWLHTARLAAAYVMTKGRDAEMGTLFNDLKFGARALARMPGSALVSVIVLAIGIGLCSFMFTIVYGIYVRGMDVPESDRVFLVYETRLERNQTQLSVPIQDFVDWRERQTSFQGLFAQRGGTINLSDDESPVRFQGAFITANAFGELGVQPLIGRGFAEGDDTPGAPVNVVLSYDTFVERYGGDPSVLGSDVRVNGEPASVLGVMPEGFEWPNNTDVWVPLRDDPLASDRRQGSYVTVYGRLVDGVEAEQAEAEMASIARQLEQEYPETNEGIGARLYTVVEANMDDTLNMVFGAMMFAVLCVLLVACANVANLLLARAAMRTKEAGLRVALGGGRFRVMLPFFAEAFVLAAAGAVLGIVIAVAAVSWFDGVTDPALTGRPWFMRFEIDWPILGFVVLVTCLTALAAGIAPALKMSKTDVNAVLKDESRGSSGLIVGRLSRVLVTAEVALSCALLVGAGLMTRSIVNLGSAEYAFETEGVLTARVGLFETDYPDAGARHDLWRDLAEGLAASPQIGSVALTSSLPFQGGARIGVAIEGQAVDDPDDLPDPNRIIVTPGFFDVFGVPVIAGRDFTVQDDSTSRLVAIVNQPMVERYFEGRDPLGARFRIGASDTLPQVTVVGVVPDMSVMGSFNRFPGFEPAAYYVPLLQNDLRFMSITATPRGGDVLAVTPDVRAAVRRVDGDLPIYDVMSQAAVIDRNTWFFEVFGTVFIVFGIAALFMASVGLYGVLSFAVTRRTQEMGIRMALGANGRAVVGLVARQGAGQLGIGLGIGLALAFGVTRLIGFLMYDVDPQDPVVFGGVFGLIVLVGLAAAVFPALRATAVSPVEALRQE